MPSIAQIRRKASAVDINKAKTVRVLSDNIRFGRRGMTRFQTETMLGKSNRTLSSRLHNQAVYPASYATYPGKLINTKDVKVYCSCQRWMYYFEVAMYEKGAADLISSNGEMPTTTNPSMSMGICGHLVQVLKYIEKNGL